MHTPRNQTHLGPIRGCSLLPTARRQPREEAAAVSHGASAAPGQGLRAQVAPQLLRPWIHACAQARLNVDVILASGVSSVGFCRGAPAWGVGLACSSGGVEQRQSVRI